jgi:mannose-6-phosphate isomerase-like protein (cupin superfamily)
MAELSKTPYDRFESSALLAQQMVKGEPYLEFLRRDSMSAGIYVLEAGADDLQQPHAQDELYHVLEGQAVLEVNGDQRPVKSGSTVFVAAGVAHRFHSIATKLSVLVIFAPPEDPADSGT